MPANLTISGRYDIVAAIPGAGGRSYHARHKVLGHELMVHFLTRTGALPTIGLLEKIRQLPDQERRLFIDAGEHDNAPFVVSWHLPGFDTLANWVDRVSHEPVSHVPVVTPRPEPVTPPVAIVEPPPPPPAPEEASIPPEPVTPSKRPGEFTRRFGPGESPLPPPTPEPPPKAVEEPPLPPEFFSDREQARPETPPPLMDFSEYSGSPAPLPTDRERQSFSARSESTLPAAPETPLPVPPRLAVDASYTEVIRSGGAAPAADPAPPMPQAAPSPAFPMPSKLPPIAPIPMPAPQMPKAPKIPSGGWAPPTWISVAFGLLLMAAVLLILYFLLSR